FAAGRSTRAERPASFEPAAVDMIDDHAVVVARAPCDTEHAALAQAHAAVRRRAGDRPLDAIVVAAALRDRDAAGVSALSAWVFRRLDHPVARQGRAGFGFAFRGLGRSRRRRDRRSWWG